MQVEREMLKDLLQCLIDELEKISNGDHGEVLRIFNAYKKSVKRIRNNILMAKKIQEGLTQI